LFEFIFDPYNYPFWVFIAAIIIGVLGGISRPFATYVAFAYPNAKYEAMGNPYVTDRELSRVVESSDLTGFIDSINSSKDYNLSGESTLDVQRSLDENLIQTIETMRKEGSKKMNSFFDTYIEKLDIHLIKNTIKNKLEDKKIDEGIAEKATLSKNQSFLQAILDSEKTKIPELLKEYGFEKEVIDTISEETIFSYFLAFFFISSWWKNKLFPLNGLKGAVFIERSFSNEEIISFAKVVFPELYSNRPPMKTINVIAIT